jgi:hypothetical protein
MREPHSEQRGRHRVIDTREQVLEAASDPAGLIDHGPENVEDDDIDVEVWRHRKYSSVTGPSRRYRGPSSLLSPRVVSCGLLEAHGQDGGVFELRCPTQARGNVLLSVGRVSA